MNTGNLLSKLAGVKSAGKDRWAARCPAHDDKHASLSIRNDAGTVLLKCHAGCDAEKIVGAVGLNLSDLFTEPRARVTPARRIVAEYDYRDADGVILYQAVRYAPKDFRQRRPDGNGGWLWSLNGTKRVLYCLPELLAADRGAWVFVTEGEKDADAIRDLGLIATCNAGGAGKWGMLSDDNALHNRRVCVIADKDEVGRKHARDVAERLTGKAATVRVVEMPGDGIKDVSDWIGNLDCRTGEELAAALIDMADDAPDWTSDTLTTDPLESLDAELQAERAGLRRPIPLAFASRLAGVSRMTMPGGLVVLAGSPGSAKSFMALSMLLAATDAGHRASYLPLESDRAFHLRRLLAVIDGSWRALSDPLKVADAIERAGDALELHRERMAEIGPCILENPCKPIRNSDGKLAVPDISADDVLKMIEARAETDKLVILDPFTMISFGGREEWRAQDAFIRRLRGIAAESRAVICIVAHLTKRVEGPLDLGHVQGASTFTRVADVVLMLQKHEAREFDVWADDSCSMRKTSEGNMTVTIGKARNGEGTGLHLAYSFGVHGPLFTECGIIAPKSRQSGAMSINNHWAQEV